MSESFEDVCASYGDFTWIGRDEVKKIIARLQMAHEHEMEQHMREQYHCGYIAGQKSMDAEHYAVALRLRQLPLDGGSHENLSSIARAIWHGDFGWTKGACSALRDKIIELLGGVHDEPVPMDASGGADCADCDCGAGESGRVSYDVLGNERHEAVCELRNVRDNMSDNMADNVSRIMYAIDARPKVGERACKAIADRIIHLLGGDEPAESFIETLVKDTEELSRQGKVRFPPNADGSLDGLKTVEETAALIDEVKRRAKSDKIGENCETDASSTGESSKYQENCKSGHIADELREKIHEKVNQELYVVVEADDLYAIADRIDEWFKRLCEQQEAVLQKTIDGMVDERDELKKQRDGYKKAMCAAQDLLEKRTCERDELRRTLRKIAEHAGVPHDRDLTDYSDEAVIDAIYWCIDNYYQINIDELQAQVIECCKQRDKAREKAVNYRNSRHEMQRRLELECDDVKRQCDELQKKLADYNRMVMERDDLRKKLDAIREALDGQQRHVD